MTATIKPRREVVAYNIIASIELEAPDLERSNVKTRANEIIETVLDDATQDGDLNHAFEIEDTDIQWRHVTWTLKVLPGRLEQTIRALHAEHIKIDQCGSEWSEAKTYQQMLREAGRCALRAEVRGETMYCHLRISHMGPHLYNRPQQQGSATYYVKDSDGESADEVMDLWSKGVALVYQTITGGQQLDCSPAETTEETISGILGRLTTAIGQIKK